MEKIPKLTKKDFEDLEEEKKRNFEERLKFIDQYAQWLKKTSNKEWSKQHAKFFGQVQSEEQ